MASIKARDIRFHLKGKVDPVLLQTLEAMAEEVSQLQHVLAQTVSFVQMMLETVEKMGIINENLKTKYEALERAGKNEHDLGDLSTAEGKKH